jgi:ABC-2 type transport system permease protein
MIGPLLTGGALLAARSAPAGPSEQTLVLSPTTGGFEAHFSRDFPLSPAARAKLIEGLRGEGVAVTSAAPEGRSSDDIAALSRFMLVVMLWTTLTGSLGLLLQAVVRERANRALEILLAAARPLDIVLGKVLGIGALSTLVLATWLAGPVLAAAFAPASGSLTGAILHQLADPVLLLRGAVIYVLAFGFYGFVTVMVGSMARDNAEAQNLARPVFAVLLAVFFAALAAAGGGGGPAWLVYVPPFTPFLLLATPTPAGIEAPALLIMVGATLLAAWCAGRALRLEGAALIFLRRRRA